MHGFVCKLKVSGFAVFEAWSACQMELVSAFLSEIPGRWSRMEGQRFSHLSGNPLRWHPQIQSESSTGPKKQAGLKAGRQAEAQSFHVHRSVWHHWRQWPPSRFTLLKIQPRCFCWSLPEAVRCQWSSLYLKVVLNLTVPASDSHHLCLPTTACFKSSYLCTLHSEHSHSQASSLLLPYSTMHFCLPSHTPSISYLRPRTQVSYLSCYQSLFSSPICLFPEPTIWVGLNYSTTWVFFLSSPCLC